MTTQGRRQQTLTSESTYSKSYISSARWKETTPRHRRQKYSHKNCSISPGTTSRYGHRRVGDREGHNNKQNYWENPLHSHREVRQPEYSQSNCSQRWHQALHRQNGWNIERREWNIGMEECKTDIEETTVHHLDYGKSKKNNKNHNTKQLNEEIYDNFTQSIFCPGSATALLQAGSTDSMHLVPPYFQKVQLVQLLALGGSDSPCSSGMPTWGGHWHGQPEGRAGGIECAAARFQPRPVMLPNFFGCFRPGCWGGLVGLRGGRSCPCSLGGRFGGGGCDGGVGGATAGAGPPDAWPPEIPPMSTPFCWREGFQHSIGGGVSCVGLCFDKLQKKIHWAVGSPSAGVFWGCGTSSAGSLLFILSSVCLSIFSARLFAWLISLLF